MYRKINLGARAIFALVPFASSGCDTDNSGVDPNVLIIILDDAGYNDFGFMGCPDIETPNIDALVSDGVVLTDGHVTASVSGPSRCGILTGCYQQRGGYECNYEGRLGMSLENNTIADVFQDNGYKTICIGKWHQGDNPEYHPNQRGFDEFYGFISGARSYFYRPDGVDAPDNRLNYIQHNGAQVEFDQYLTYQFGDTAINYINNVGDQPFMMYLSYNAVHGPFEATAEDLARFEGHPRQMLAAMTYAVDRSIGEVILALKASGKYDNTLIFFLSDNGGVSENNVSNYPLKGWKGNKYEGGHRVPFAVVYGDNLPQGTTYGGLCSSLDIFVTAIAAAGIEYDGQGKPLDGVNIIPYINNDNSQEPHDYLFWRKYQQKAVRWKDYKLIEVDGMGSVLYNIKEDLGESNDISVQHPEIRDNMLKQLRQWEGELVNPVLWSEGSWNKVNVEIHRALMNNETDIINSPVEYKRKYGAK